MGLAQHKSLQLAQSNDMTKYYKTKKQAQLELLQFLKVFVPECQLMEQEKLQFSIAPNHFYLCQLHVQHAYGMARFYLFF